MSLARTSHARRPLGPWILIVSIAALLAASSPAWLSGCASTGLVDVWRDPEGAAAPLENVLVVTMKRDDARRRLMEDAFVAALGKRGVRATPSYRLFAGDIPDTNQIDEAVRSNGFDGVISVSRLGTRTTENVVPGYTTTEARLRYNRWARRYQTYYVDVHHPGYVDTDRVVRHRVDVWSTAEGGRLLWTAEGQSIDPGSATDVSREVSGSVIPDLVKSGIIPKR